MSGVTRPGGLRLADRLAFAGGIAPRSIAGRRRDGSSPAGFVRCRAPRSARGLAGRSRDEVVAAAALLSPSATRLPCAPPAERPQLRLAITGADLIARGIARGARDRPRARRHPRRARGTGASAPTRPRSSPCPAALAKEALIGVLAAPGARCVASAAASFKRAGTDAQPVVGPTFCAEWVRQSNEGYDRLTLFRKACSSGRRAAEARTRSSGIALGPRSSQFYCDFFARPGRSGRSAARPADGPDRELASCFAVTLARPNGEPQDACASTICRATPPRSSSLRSALEGLGGFFCRRSRPVTRFAPAICRTGDPSQALRRLGLPGPPSGEGDRLRRDRRHERAVLAVRQDRRAAVPVLAARSPAVKGAGGARRVRILAGRWKGRALPVPAGARPTSGRARAALFDLLGRSVSPGSRVLDLYAGSGAVGLEAVSRGAAAAVLVERGRGRADAHPRRARRFSEPRR